MPYTHATTDKLDSKQVKLKANLLISVYVFLYMEKLAVPSMEEQNDNKVIINLRSSFIHIIPTRNSDSDVTISSKNNVFLVAPIIG